MSFIPDPASLSTCTLYTNDSTQNKRPRVPLEIEGDRTVVVRSIARSEIVANVRGVSAAKAEIPSNRATHTGPGIPIVKGRITGCFGTSHRAVVGVTKIKASCPYACQITGNSGGHLIQVGANQHTAAGRQAVYIPE